MEQFKLFYLRYPDLLEELAVVQYTHTDSRSGDVVLPYIM
jgi:hypothetical protein